MRTVANAIIDLSNDVRAILLQEPRLLKLAAPTYVLGKLKYFTSLEIKLMDIVHKIFYNKPSTVKPPLMYAL